METLVETLRSFRKAVVENKRRYILAGDRRAVDAANAQLRVIDAKLVALGVL